MTFKELVVEIAGIRNEGDRQGAYNLIDYSFKNGDITGDEKELLKTLAYKIDAYAEMYK